MSFDYAGAFTPLNSNKLIDRPHGIRTVYLASLIISIGLSSKALAAPPSLQLETRDTNTTTTITRELSHPSCAICSYGPDNVEHKIYAVAHADTGKLIESVEEFTQLVGHGFLGHRLCCDFDPKQDTHNITNHYGHVLTVKLSTEKPVVQEPANVTVTSRRRAATKEPATQFIQQPPTCVPLLSVNPLFNPYSELLTPPGSATRSLLAFPYYTNKSVSCPSSASGSYDVQVTDTVTTTSSLSYSITDGKSNSYTNSIGSTSTVGTSTEAMQSISDTLEQSNTFTHTSTQGGSQSQTWSQALTKTSESQTNWQRTHGTDVQSTLSVGRDVSTQQSHSQESGTSSSDQSGWDAKGTVSATVSASESFGVVQGSISGTVSAELGASGSHTDGSSQSVTDSSTQSQSQSYNMGRQMGSSDSSTAGGSRSDSISDSITNSKTSE
ncbi:hypothetical protein HDU76_004588, partial [Blyttiomyces sp. JEL0837]